MPITHAHAHGFIRAHPGQGVLLDDRLAMWFRCALTLNAPVVAIRCRTDVGGVVVLPVKILRA